MARELHSNFEEVSTMLDRKIFFHLVSAAVSAILLALTGCPSIGSGDGDSSLPATGGSLSYVDRYSHADIKGADSVMVSPDGKHAYVTAENTETVAWFDRQQP